MTREEAKQDYYNNQNEWYIYTFPDMIDEIYDDFESRTCENCKEHCLDNYCVEKERYTDDTDSCKEFKRKDNNGTNTN